MDEEVLTSERATNDRNEAMARLLVGHGRIYFDADRPPTCTPGCARCR